MTPEQRLKRIARIYETVRKSKGGLSISSHAGYNLEGAIIDIERTGKCDAVCLRTIKRVRDQLLRIGRILND